MSNTITIVTSYNSAHCGELELPEGRTWKDVADWGIKWHTLYIEWTDGTETSHELGELGSVETDMKRPSDVTIEDGQGDILDET
jgi:hypothetical protein